MKSIVEQRGSVVFPEFTGERVYMREFKKCDGLPFDLARWQPTVSAMLEGIETDGPIYLMVDQALVQSGSTHRRGGVHIDGYWNPGSNDHGSRPPGRHIVASGWDTEPKWNTTNNGVFWPDEALLLASSVSACRAFSGEVDGMPSDGGDCSHLDVSDLEAIDLKASQVYAGNVTMLHESIPVQVSCLRTVVRLNVPGWSPR